LWLVKDIERAALKRGAAKTFDTRKEPLGEAAFLDHASSFDLRFSAGEVDSRQVTYKEVK
jgi:hypothetical protein